MAEKKKIEGVNEVDLDQMEDVAGGYFWQARLPYSLDELSNNGVAYEYHTFKGDEFSINGKSATRDEVLNYMKAKKFDKK